MKHWIRNKILEVWGPQTFSLGLSKKRREKRGKEKENKGRERERKKEKTSRKTERDGYTSRNSAKRHSPPYHLGESNERKKDKRTASQLESFHPAFPSFFVFSLFFLSLLFLFFFLLVEAYGLAVCVFKCRNELLFPSDLSREVGVFSLVSPVWLQQMSRLCTDTRKTTCQLFFFFTENRMDTDRHLDAHRHS